MPEDNVKELLKWVATGIEVSQCAACGGKGEDCVTCTPINADKLAKQILSHPDLALINRDVTRNPLATVYSVIPLSEAIKELK